MRRSPISYMVTSGGFPAGSHPWVPLICDVLSTMTSGTKDDIRCGGLMPQKNFWQHSLIARLIANIPEFRPFLYKLEPLISKNENVPAPGNSRIKKPGQEKPIQRGSIS